MPAGRPSGTSAMPPAARTTAATPSRSSATTSKSTSGSVSPSTVSWPITWTSARSCSTIDDNYLSRETDTEVLMHQICAALSTERRPPLMDVCRHLARKFDGAYSIVFFDALGNMMVARDPLGIKPLSYAVEGPVVRRGQRERGPAEPRLRGREHQVGSAGPCDHDQRRQVRDSALRRARASAALFLRVGLFRQRGQHAGRPQRVSCPQGPGRGTGPAGDGADRRRHGGRAGARHEQGRGRRDGLRLEGPIASKG